MTNSNRRIDEKCKLLDKHSTSEDLFNELVDNIRTLSSDESGSDFSVGDEYNFGTDYKIELLLEVISDLRFYTRFSKNDDNKHITDFNLNYLRDYL